MATRVSVPSSRRPMTVVVGGRSAALSPSAMSSVPPIWLSLSTGAKASMPGVITIPPFWYSPGQRVARAGLAVGGEVGGPLRGRPGDDRVEGEPVPVVVPGQHGQVVDGLRGQVGVERQGEVPTLVSMTALYAFAGSRHCGGGPANSVVRGDDPSSGRARRRPGEGGAPGLGWEAHRRPGGHRRRALARQRRGGGGGARPSWSCRPRWPRRTACPPRPAAPRSPRRWR